MKHVFGKLVLACLLTVLTQQAFAQQICLDLFQIKTKPNFEFDSNDPENAVIRAVYYNGRKMTKETDIKLKGQVYRIVDWAVATEGNHKFITLRNNETNEIVRFTFDAFPKGAWRVKEVRLAELLKYQNENIVLRTMRDHPQIDRATAERASRELMKWFFVKFRSEIETPEKFRAFMFTEMDIVDYAWHSFLLFSVDYKNFSNKYFGSFIEHTPGSGRFKPEEVRPHFYEFVKETLGEQTHDLWFKSGEYDPRVYDAKIRQREDEANKPVIPQPANDNN